MKKVGRNNPCPCGSGEKFKKCHGSINYMDHIASLMADAPIMQARHQAREYQRMQQQGHGRPIISTQLRDGARIVAIKNRLLHSKNSKTFHDFLIGYIATLIGPDWGNAELKKPLKERHPILVWYEKLCSQQHMFIKEPGQVTTGPMIGAVAAYLNLAYDLYSLDHNAELQSKLIERLKNREGFAGARYETQVAAKLVRAGFEIEFENEDDRTTSHCEFTATNISTGKKFSVEAKRSESGRTNRQIIRALHKTANHTRIVFIDLNTSDQQSDAMPPPFMQRTFDLLRRLETVDPIARRLPPAYIIFTNDPWEHHLDAAKARCTAFADGFHIPEFKIDHKFNSLRAAVDGRQKHIEMHNLLKSMRFHNKIPATFDGQNPELLYKSESAPLLIGDRCKFQDTDGTENEGIITSAVVLEESKSAMFTISTRENKNIIHKYPLSETQIKAWKLHPETFFGTVSKNNNCESPLDIYDFFIKSYGNTPKDKLLEFMAQSPEIKHLTTLDQPELAKIYCENMAWQVMLAGGKSPPEPILRTKWKSTKT